MASTIQVVLQDDVENLGTSGDVVRVRPGYARNYLIPRGVAVVATKANIARIDDVKKQAAIRSAKQLEEAKEFAKKIEAVAVKIERSVGEENKMYGSVTSKDIEDAYADQGIALDRRMIQLEDPIKTLGLSEVPCKLHKEVAVSLRVEVIKKTS